MKKLFSVAMIFALVMGCESPESADAAVAGIRINEVNGNGEKYIELYNPTSSAVDISNMYISKNEKSNPWVTIPKGTTIESKAYAVIPAEGRVVTGSIPGAEGRSGISMNQGLLIELYDKNGWIVDEFQRGSAPWGVEYSYAGYRGDRSFGRNPDGSGSWVVYTEATANESNSRSVVWSDIDNEPFIAPENAKTPDTAVAGIRINEVNGNGQKFIELYNTTSSEIDISRMYILKNGKREPWVRIPNNIKIAANGFVVFRAEGMTVTGSIAEGMGGISMNQALLFELYDRNGNKVDEFRRGGEPWGVSNAYDNYGKEKSYGRQPDGSDNWKVLKNSTPKASNNSVEVSSNIDNNPL